jgi:hypothetical protein
MSAASPNQARRPARGGGVVALPVGGVVLDGAAVLDGAVGTLVLVLVLVVVLGVMGSVVS